MSEEMNLAQKTIVLATVVGPGKFIDTGFDVLNAGNRIIKSTGKIGWSMPKGGGVINGRKYSEHALERMAPNTSQVRAELTTRAHQKAAEKGLKSGTKEYHEFVTKYVDPHGITPSVVDDAIKNTPVKPGKYDGTFVHQNENVTVITNKNGDIVTVIPR